MQSDEDLLEAWRAGDRNAGSHLLARRVREITWFFRNKVLDESDVSDLVGQTFLGCVTSRDRFRGDTSFRRFIYSIAQNALREYLRAKTKRAREQLDFTQVCIRDLRPRSLSSIQTHKRELQALVEALRDVPIDDQIVLELKYFEGLSGRELGELLDVPEGTVRGRLSRGLDRLRQRVQARLHAGDPTAEPPSIEQLEAWATQLRAQRGASE
jgi:RNA polymerase sigma-70 factor (ECF subfamily)